MRITKVLIIEGQEVHVSFPSPDISMVRCDKVQNVSSKGTLFFPAQL